MDYTLDTIDSTASSCLAGEGGRFAVKLTRNRLLLANMYVNSVILNLQLADENAESVAKQQQEVINCCNQMSGNEALFCFICRNYRTKNVCTCIMCIEDGWE